MKISVIVQRVKKIKEYCLYFAYYRFSKFTNWISSPFSVQCQNGYMDHSVVLLLSNTVPGVSPRQSG